MSLLRGSRQRRHRRMEEEEYGGEGDAGYYEGEAEQYTAMQVDMCPSHSPPPRLCLHLSSLITDPTKPRL